MVVLMAQLTTAFPPVSQVYSVLCPGASHLHQLIGEQSGSVCSAPGWGDISGVVPSTL